MPYHYQLIVNWWFGSRWFRIQRGYPCIKIPFSLADMRMQKNNNQGVCLTKQELSRCSEFVNVFCFPDASAPRFLMVSTKKPSVPQFQSQHRQPSFSREFPKQFQPGNRGSLGRCCLQPMARGRIPSSTSHAPCHRQLPCCIQTSTQAGDF